MNPRRRQKPLRGTAAMHVSQVAVVCKPPPLQTPGHRLLPRGPSNPPLPSYPAPPLPSARQERTESHRPAPLPVRLGKVRHLEHAARLNLPRSSRRRSNSRHPRPRWLPRRGAARLKTGSGDEHTRNGLKFILQLTTGLRDSACFGDLGCCCVTRFRPWRRARGAVEQATGERVVGWGGTPCWEGLATGEMGSAMPQ